jgi:hypothetical protein
MGSPESSDDYLLKFLFDCIIMHYKEGFLHGIGSTRGRLERMWRFERG